MTRQYDMATFAYRSAVLMFVVAIASDQILGAAINPATINIAGLIGIASLAVMAYHLLRYGGHEPEDLEAEEVEST